MEGGKNEMQTLGGNEEIRGKIRVEDGKEREIKQKDRKGLGSAASPESKGGPALLSS